MNKIRVVHYVNQFFGGIGGEKEANIPPGVKKGPVGPGQLLQSLIAEKGEIVATVYCGDNYINQNWESAIREIVRIISDLHPSVVIAGPAFSSGRYGIACGGICNAVQEEIGIPSVCGMYEENPAVDQYRSKVYIVATSETVIGMEKAIPVMAKLAMKLALSEPIGSPFEEGYLPKGKRLNEFAEKTGAERAIDMIIKKMKREDFVSELPLPRYELVPSAPPIKDLSKATIALVTEGGLVPTGNPDKIESGWATKWKKYSIQGISSLLKGSYECVHGGFDTSVVNEDPNRLVPLDSVADMEKAGEIGRLDDHYYVTVGNMGSIQVMKKFGAEMAKELKAASVQGVILTAT